MGLGLLDAVCLGWRDYCKLPPKKMENQAGGSVE